MTRSQGRSPCGSGSGVGAPVDVTEIRGVVSRALAQGPHPRYEDLEQLDIELRAHIGLLLPSAEAAVDELWHGSVEWDGRRARLDAIRHRLGLGLGDGLLSATIHVRHLARDCDALLNYLEAQR